MNDTPSARTATVAAGKLPGWTMANLPAPPAMGLRSWVALIGPGMMMAGVAIGAGEWLFGPAVASQYGGTILWLATISILCQLVVNLEVMRYALYCGEPVYVGFLRTRPGPKVWAAWYLLMDVSNIWPFMAATAAVPLAAALLGHLPGDGTVQLLGTSLSEVRLVKVLGYAVFLLAFLPLIFGGTIYRSIERLMSLKVIVALSFLCILSVFTVSYASLHEVVTGFFRFGALPLRADTIIVGPHFELSESRGGDRYTIKGTVEPGQTLITEFVASRGPEPERFGMHAAVPADLAAVRQGLVDRANSLAREGRFFVEDTQDGVQVRLVGQVLADQTWKLDRIEVLQGGQAQSYDRLEDLPAAAAGRAQSLFAYQGVERVGMLGYLWEHGRLPDLNWAILAAFAAIAGIGGTGNALCSNYARDKGWGMGKLVGAIPSAVGGSSVTLLHIGKTFPMDEANLGRWRGWMRYVQRDQLVVWTFCCFLGMALPCLVSLEFLRNVPVEGHRVAAMIADGAARRYPDLQWLLWPATLLCGFLILAPGQIFSGEAIARRWTDVLWSSSRRAQRLRGPQVRYIYYTILGVYAVWGLVWLSLFEPLTLAIIGAILGNLALASTALHTLYVNRTLLPARIRPPWFMQAGLLICGAFFLGISVIVWIYL